MERDSSIWLTNESNRKLDRISMAFSIEARSPFQDERVIEVAHQIMNENRFKSHDKQTLRKLFPSLNVAGVRDDKAGFISPVGHWLRTNPQIVSNGLDAVLNSGLFNKNEIARRRNDQFSGDFTRIRQLWSLVVLGYWFLHTWEK
jgi:asparagine synthase (glutamine-hydrolysing)